MYELIPSDTSHQESATGKWYHSTASTIYTQYIFCKIWYRRQYIATGKWYHSTASTHNILFCFIWDKGCDMLGAIYCHQNYSYKFNVCMCVIRIMHVRLLLLFSDVLTRLLLLQKKETRNSRPAESDPYRMRYIATSTIYKLRFVDILPQVIVRGYNITKSLHWRH